ncbi:hypothetical protein BDN67DRAFT_992844 [Paxillus ammoniavirescens]|nr:hypothetical protein BDN67DRAFT_992844 [Paxillus ammoniavirescens]
MQYHLLAKQSFPQLVSLLPPHIKTSFLCSMKNRHTLLLHLETTGSNEKVTVPGFRYRPLVEVIRSAFSDAQAKAFHLWPFKQYWDNPSGGEVQRLFGELYTSDSWIAAHKEVIAGLMFFSDATHLATFGNAKALQTHCRRELLHACWDILLDNKFLEAYHHGIVLHCGDGVFRLVFPRIFTYSADYPEKVLIATIRDMGRCPCPHCLVPKHLINHIGLLSNARLRVSRMRQFALHKVQQVREYILQEARAVDGSFVEHLLSGESWVPTVNVFASKLSHLGLDPFRMLVVDFLHECESGTWKSLFSHLIRLLYALPRGSGRFLPLVEEPFENSQAIRQR